ncbi:hypothetical protein [Clostridium felsineum]|uniref:hypothetical protein n=1 Tax=Clostridium felsineum TaxID=36839 RepID=UPI0009C59F5C|nr:hypothetical protein [Clostridium felsineum]URZ16848.1 hypothetical protein CLFE_028950 [Clostridium felsineum DSM 794]
MGKKEMYKVEIIYGQGLPQTIAKKLAILYNTSQKGLQEQSKPKEAEGNTKDGKQIK